MRKVIYTEDAPKPIGPYSQAIFSNDTLYCSGQIPLDAKTGQLVGSDVRTQTKKVIENISAVLSAAGLTFDEVVKTTCFLEKMSDFADFNDVYKDYFTSCPARSCVAAAGLPKGALVEIEVIAVRKS